MPLRLTHVSERGDIEPFEPREAAPGRPAVVWAVDEDHLVNYLVPRDCPRVCFRMTDFTSIADRERFLPSGRGPVIAIEPGWLQRVSTATLWLYELPAESFAAADANAGYYTASTAVRPLQRRRMDDPLVELAAHGAELRVVPDLRALATEVAASTLSFSCIRMRSAES